MKSTVIKCIFIYFILFLNKNTNTNLSMSMSTKLAGIYLIKNIFYPQNVMAFNKMPEQLYSLEFEVFGVVQGVFFRKHTEKQAKSLGLTGWCRNTEEGTVKGTVEGEKPRLNKMKQWLEKTGSPSSRIDKAVFSDITSIPELIHKEFTIRS